MTRDVSWPLPTDDTATLEFIPDFHTSTMFFRRIYWPVLYFKIFFSAGNLNVLFAQGMSVDLCPQMTQLPLNSLLIFTQVQCSSVVWVQPIDHALNNGLMLTGWGWTAVVNNVLSTTLLSSRKHFDHHTCLPWWAIGSDEPQKHI